MHADKSRTTRRSVEDLHRLWLLVSSAESCALASSPPYGRRRLQAGSYQIRSRWTSRIATRFSLRCTRSKHWSPDQSELHLGSSPSLVPTRVHRRHHLHIQKLDAACPTPRPQTAREDD